MKPFLAAVFLSVAVVLYMGWLTGAIPSEATYCEINQETKKKDCAVDKIILVALWQCGKFLEKSSEAITALASIAIAFFTWTLYRATKALWEAGENQRRHFQTSERAFISVSFRHSANRDIVTGAINFWTFTPIWLNLGNTPTQNMRNHINLRLQESELPADWTFPDQWASGTPEIDRVATPLSVGPKGRLDGQGLSVPVEAIERVIAEQQFLYFWGWAAYDDAFEGTPPRVTRFAVRIVIGGIATDPERISFSYTYLRRYNCADDECTRQGFAPNWMPQTLIV